MSKKCEGCGRFMALRNIIPDSDEFDEELAFECGLTEDQLDEAYNFDSKWARFRYIQDQWECDECQTQMSHEEGKRYYWNPKSGNYDGAKPLTPKEKVLREQKRQEKAGQQRLF